MPRLTTLVLLVTVELPGCYAWAQSSPAAQEPASTTQNSAAQNSASAQQSPSATQTAPAPAPDPAPKLTFEKVDFTGLVDVYYSFNNNHPGSDFNQLYNFDDKTNQFDLNMAKLTISHDPDPVGFRIDAGLGRAFDVVHTPKSDPEFFDYLEQAYTSIKPKNWKGFEADFGEFVTSAGAEVIETKDNWNYSRSLLFSWAIPYYHFGLRTSMPLGNTFAVGFQLVNGWNAIVDDHGNNMKTVGLTGTITRKKFTWSHNYYIGPQYTAINNRNRGLYDTTVLLTPTDKLNAYLNFDYGQQRRAISGLDHWIGFAGALHFQLNKYFAISPRAEYYNDATGFTTGTRQKLHEVTVTGEYKMMRGLLGRLEYRRDDSNVLFFYRGNTPAASKSQNTATIGVVAFYPPPKS